MCCRYGKTARGLAIDWETSVAEAKETVDRWYTKKKKNAKFRNNFFLLQVRRSVGSESVARRDHTSRSIDRLHQDVDGSFASFAWHSQVILMCFHWINHVLIVFWWCYFNSKRRGERTHAERAAINTPLQVMFWILFKI